jgi:hypothetical protein
MPLYVAVGLSLVLGVGSVMAYYALDAESRALVSGFQLWTLVFFVLVMIAIMLSVAVGYVRADQGGLTFRNGPRKHRLPWEAVAGIRFEPGDPWPYVLLDVEFAGDDHDRMMLMGIQGSDGAHAKRQVDELRAAVAHFKSGR